MNKFFDQLGLLAGVIGVGFCILAVATRLMGQYYLFGTELRMWLLGGIALIVMGCFAKLQVLTAESAK
ncbi:hypothetical protein [Kineobactrum sediminis]|nr:hypothetical protein [Kineobactrum sediminis]